VSRSVNSQAPDSQPNSAPADAFATQSEAAYSRIRQDILSGALLPGRKLLLEGLRDQYQFGSSPLREALSRLTSDRLVIAKGQRGYWVASISQEDFEDITAMRLYLEPHAVQLSIANATLDWEGRLVAAHHRLRRLEGLLQTDPVGLSGDWDRENRAFHLALIDRCQSEWLLRFVQTLAEHSERYRRQAIALRAVPKERIQREHQAIFDAAIERDASLAAELLKRHIRNSAASESKAIFGETPSR
jgi:GntR family carbon starvation induced transcriptional regulator